jgi:hypothetical protein
MFSNLVAIFVFLGVIKFVIHVAFLNLSAALHEPLNSFVNFFIFSHGLQLTFDAIGTGETSEVKVSIIFNQIFRVT